MVKNDYKLCLILVKYIPILSMVMQMIYLLLYLLGYNIIFLQNSSGISLLVFVLIINLTSVFKYCTLHKMVLLYSALIDTVAPFIIKGHLYIFIIGIFLFYKLITHRYKYECNRNRP